MNLFKQFYCNQVVNKPMLKANHHVILLYLEIPFIGRAAFSSSQLPITCNVRGTQVS